LLNSKVAEYRRLIESRIKTLYQDTYGQHF
jgi:hypothetical protein